MRERPARGQRHCGRVARGSCVWGAHRGVRVRADVRVACGGVGEESKAGAAAARRKLRAAAAAGLEACSPREGRARRSARSPRRGAARRRRRAAQSGRPFETAPRCLLPLLPQGARTVQVLRQRLEGGEVLVAALAGGVVGAVARGSQVLSQRSALQRAQAQRARGAGVGAHPRRSAQRGRLRRRGAGSGGRHL